MTRAVRGGQVTDARRRPPVAPVLALTILLLAACPSPGAEGDRTSGRTATQRPASATPTPSAAPVPVEPDDRAAIGPAVSVDLARGGSTGLPLDVAGAPDGGAVVLVRAPPREPPRMVLVAPDGAHRGSVPAVGLASAGSVHVLPSGTALVTGRLAQEEALGYAVIDPRTGSGHTVTAVPLDEATSRAAVSSAVAPDGRTVWLYSTMLVDGRFSYLLTGHDTASGELVASRDPFPELRAIHVPEQELDEVGLAPSVDGGVVLAVNAYPRSAGPFARPFLLVYDAALEPVGAPVPLAIQEEQVTARAVAPTADGTTLVVVRGATSSRLVALPPGGRDPEPRVEMAGFGFTDQLAADARGHAVLPGRLGARRVDPATGAATDIDVGCAGVASVSAFATSPAAGVWMLGGCLEEGRTRPFLWRVA